MSVLAHSPYVVSDSKSRRGSVLCSKATALHTDYHNPG